MIDDPNGRTTGSSGSGGAGGEASGSAGAAGEGESNAKLPACDEAGDTNCDDGEG